MSKPNIIGTMLKQVRIARDEIITKATNELLKRNNITFADSTNGFKLVESTVVGKDGVERTGIRLWKLVDESLVSITPNVTTQIQTAENKKDW